MKQRLLSGRLPKWLALFAAAPMAALALPNITSVTQTNGDDNANQPPGYTGLVYTHTNLGANYRAPFFTGGETVAFRDRVHEWTWAGPAIPWPSYLVGGEIIQQRNDNRDNATLTMTVTIAEESWVYVLVDNRLGDQNGGNPPTFTSTMTWLAAEGFQPIMTGSNRTADNTRPDEIGIDEGADGAGPGAGINQWSSIYGKLIPAGTFTLYQADNAGQNMYGVVIKAVARAPRFAGGSGNLLGFNFQIEEGSVTQLNPQSVTATLDGTPVTVTGGTLENGMYTFRYSVPTWLPSASQHTVNVAYADNANPAGSFTATFNFTADTYKIIGAAETVPAASVDQTSSGFLMRIAQYKDAARWPGNDLPNDTRRAEDQLAGRIIDPVTLLPIENFAVQNAEAGSGGYYNPAVINMNDAVSAGAVTQTGSFTDVGTPTSPPSPDGPIFGVPNADPDTAVVHSDNYAVEFLGYLQLQPGLYQFGVNSDDGFRLTTGKDPRSPNAVELGVFNGGRGVSDSLFYVEVTEAGIYPVRLLYYEGGGATASVEFFTRNYTTGMKTLVNDRANGGVVAYSKGTAPGLSVSVSPLNGQTGVTPRYTIQAQVYENGATLSPNSVVMTLNGATVTPTVTSANGVHSIVYEPTANHLAGVNNVTLAVGDGTTTYTHNWSFTAIDPAPIARIPAAYSVPIEHLNTGITGFLGDVYQMQNAAGTVIARTGFANNNSVEAAEFQLARGFIDPATSQPYANRVSAGSEPDGRRWIDRLNFNQQGPANAGGFNSGNGFTDATIPGLGNADENWVVGEFVTYIQLKAGHHRFVVNCDDGFKLTMSPDPRNPGAGSILLGQRSPGGGATDTFVDVFIEADGIYPMRLLWWEGTGGASCEFAYVDPETNARVLLGDIDRPLAPNVYPYYLGPARPQLRSLTPASGTIYPNQQFVATISDLAGGTVTVTSNGQNIPAQVTTEGNLTTVRFSGASLASGSAFPVRITYAGLPFDATYTVTTYPTIAEGVGRPVADADATASGLAARIFQATATPTLATTIARAESQIAGTLINPATGQPYPNTATQGPLEGGAFVAETVNWSEDSATAGQQRGSFQAPNFPDAPIPGIDPVVNSDNIAAELIGWLELPAGITQLGVNSDDGFLLTVGHSVGGNAVQVGSFDAGRGATDSVLAVNVPTAGLYPVRLVWFEGGGDASLEFFSVTPTGQKVLINDRATAGHIKAYYKLTGGQTPDPTLAYTFSSGTLSLTWANGTLQSRTSLTEGTWANVSEAQSGTHNEPTASGNKFFRVMRP